MNPKIVIRLFLLLTFIILNNSLYSQNKAFYENKGQIGNYDLETDNSVIYYNSNDNPNVFFLNDKVTFVFFKECEKNQRKNPLSYSQYQQSDKEISIFRIDLKFDNINKDCLLKANCKEQQYSNYYLAHCPQGIIDIHSFKKIIYKNIYPSIDLEFYYSNGNLKFDYIILPGGNPNDIKYQYIGADETKLTSSNSLEIVTPFGNFSEKPLYCYQKENSELITEINSKIIINNGVISYKIGDYNKSKTLVIDPEIEWSTFFGGSDRDAAMNIEIDDESNVYVDHLIRSIDIPATPGTLKVKTSTDEDICISKMTKDGELIWSTIIGGSDIDGSNVMDVRDTIIWIMADCHSSDFPVTPDAFQKTLGGYVDIVLVRLSSSGKLMYSTYYGGNGYDGNLDCEIDKYYNVWFAGRTTCKNLPITSNADRTGNDSFYDGFILKFDNSNKRVYASYFGGLNDDSIENMTLDTEGNPAVTGWTTGYYFPTTNNAFQKTFGGDTDAFLTKLDTNGKIIWSSYFGGKGFDIGSNLTSDLDGNFILYGYTNSSDIFVSGNAFQKQNAGGMDAFIAKFDNSGKIIWSTYFGGDGNEADQSLIFQTGGVETDNFGNIAISGITKSSNLPVTTDALSNTLNGQIDGFAAVFNQHGSPIWSSYIGGSQSDGCRDIAFNGKNHLHVIGWTESPDFPTTDNAFQKNYAGNGDGFVSKFSFCDEYTESQVFCPDTNIAVNASAVKIPVFAKFNSIPSPNTGIDVNFSVRFDNRIFECTGISKGTITNDVTNSGIRTIDISLVNITVSDLFILTELVGNNKGNMNDKTDFVILNCDFEINCLNNSLRNGSMTLGCSENLSTYVFIPDTSSPPTKRNFGIPLMVKFNKLPARTDRFSSTAKIRFDHDIFNFVKLSTGTVISDDTTDNFRTIEITCSDIIAYKNPLLLVKLLGQVLFTEKREMQVELLDFKWNDVCVKIDSSNSGNFIDELVCVQDLRYFIYVPKPDMSISPQPASDFINVDIESADAGEHKIKVFSVAGNAVFEKAWFQNSSNGKLTNTNVNINLSQISSGLYYLVFMAPSGTRAEPLYIVK